jgi:hypothetical protein
MSFRIFGHRIPHHAFPLTLRTGFLSCTGEEGFERVLVDVGHRGEMDRMFKQEEYNKVDTF